MRKVYLEKSWKKVLIDEFSKKYMKNLSLFLREEKVRQKEIFPEANKIFNALNSTKFDDVKVVILGQDPYHGPKQAHGLSFSVERGVKPPPSLQNIFKELENDLGFLRPNHGCLDKWSAQGVLMLNSILTVERGKPGSHANKGWETFTDIILNKLNILKKNVVFVLWGKKAQSKRILINQDKNLLIESSHPSPYSAHTGFFGSRPFSKINEYLEKYNISLIDWDLNN